MTAPAGAVVSIYVDLVRPVAVGDVIETQTGRGYRVLAVRVQARGKHAGRQHLQCLVLGQDWLHDVLTTPRDERWVHSIRWYRRERAAWPSTRPARACPAGARTGKLNPW